MKIVQQGFIHHTIKIAHEGFPGREVLARLIFKMGQITGDIAQKSLSLSNREWNKRLWPGCLSLRGEKARGAPQGGRVSVGLGCGEAAAGDQSQASTRPTLLFREGGPRAGKLIEPLLYSRTHSGKGTGESEKSLRGLRFKLVPQNLNLENTAT